MAVNAQVICEQICAGEIIVNTWAISSTTAVSPLGSTTAFAWADEFIAFYDNLSGAAAPDRGIRNHRSNDATLTRVVVREILPGNVSGLFYESAGASTGTDSGATLPLTAALVISLRTATAGRSGRGRVYLGPFTEQRLDEQQGVGQWDSGLVQEAVNAVDDLGARLAVSAPSPATLSVWSRADAAFRLVTAVRGTSKVFSQRRRNVKTPTATAFSAVP